MALIKSYEVKSFVFGFIICWNQIVQKRKQSRILLFLIKKSIHFEYLTKFYIFTFSDICDLSTKFTQNKN